MNQSIRRPRPGFLLAPNPALLQPRFVSIRQPPAVLFEDVVVVKVRLQHLVRVAWQDVQTSCHLAFHPQLDDGHDETGVPRRPEQKARADAAGHVVTQGAKNGLGHPAVDVGPCDVAHCPAPQRKVGKEKGELE